MALPSGFLEIDESAEDGVLRELAEETGIGGFRVEPFFTATGVDQDPRRRLISIVFLGEVRADELSQAAASDAADVRWFDVTDLPQTAFDHGEILGPALAVAVAD